MNEMIAEPEGRFRTKLTPGGVGYTYLQRESVKVVATDDFVKALVYCGLMRRCEEHRSEEKL